MAGQTYTHNDLAVLWTEAGGSDAWSDVAAAVAEAESGGCEYDKAGPVDDRPSAECSYRYTTTEDSYGLWQINRMAHPQYEPLQLWDALGNAKAAVAIAGNPPHFEPWTTYKTGSYRKHLWGPTYPVRLAGGKCDGQTIYIDAAEVSRGVAWCKLEQYLYVGDTHDPWVFQYAADKKAGQPVGAVAPKTAGHPSQRQVFRAWTALMHTLAYYLPEQERKTRAAIYRIRKAVR